MEKEYHKQKKKIERQFELFGKNPSLVYLKSAIALLLSLEKENEKNKSDELYETIKSFISENREKAEKQKIEKEKRDAIEKQMKELERIEKPVKKYENSTSTSTCLGACKRGLVSLEKIHEKATEEEILKKCKTLKDYLLMVQNKHMRIEMDGKIKLAEKNISKNEKMFNNNKTVSYIKNIRRYLDLLIKDNVANNSMNNEVAKFVAEKEELLDKMYADIGKSNPTPKTKIEKKKEEPKVKKTPESSPKENKIDPKIEKELNNIEIQMKKYEKSNSTSTVIGFCNRSKKKIDQIKTNNKSNLVVERCAQVLEVINTIGKKHYIKDMESKIEKAGKNVDKYVGMFEKNNSVGYLNNIRRFLDTLLKDNEENDVINDKVKKFVEEKEKILEDLQKKMGVKTSETKKPQKTTATKKVVPPKTTNVASKVANNKQEERMIQRVQKSLENAKKDNEKQFANAEKYAASNLNSAIRYLQNVTRKIESLRKEIAKNPVCVEEVNSYCQETESRVETATKECEEKAKHAASLKTFKVASAKIESTFKMTSHYLKPVSEKFLVYFEKGNALFKDFLENKEISDLNEFKEFKEKTEQNIKELEKEFVKADKQEKLKNLTKYAIRVVGLGERKIGAELNKAIEFFFLALLYKENIVNEYSKSLGEDVEEFMETFNVEVKKFKEKYQEEYGKEVLDLTQVPNPGKHDGKDVFGNIWPSKIHIDSIPVDINTKSEFYSLIGKFNKEAEEINRISELINLKLRLMDLFQFTEDIFSQQNCGSNIRDIGRKIDVLKRLTNFKKKEQKNDPIGKKMIDKVNKYVSNFESNVKSWKRCKEIQSRMYDHAVLYERAKKMFEEGVGFNGFNTDALLKIGYESQFMNRFPDYETFLEVHKLCMKSIEYMKKTEKEFKLFPMAYEKHFLELSKNAKSTHAVYCIRKYLTSQPDGRKVYINALVQFPLAVEYCKNKLKYLKYKRYERSMYDLLDDKRYQYAPPTKKPVEIFKESNNYQPSYTLIRPANPNLAVLTRPQESNTRTWTPLRKKYTSKIVFSKSVIEVGEMSDKEFDDTFVFGKDEIYGRAYWKNAIYNYPVAKDNKTGKLLYPSETMKNPNFFNRIGFIPEFLFIVSVDGKKCSVPTNPFGELGHFEERTDSEDKTNFYRRNQSCKMFILKKQIDLMDEYESIAQQFALTFSKLSKGKHKVKIDLCYRLVTTSSNLEATSPLFPEIDTLMSHPIASGSFTIEIPKNAKLPNPLPPNNTSVRNVSAINSAVANVAKCYSEKEIFLYSSLIGNMMITSKTIVKQGDKFFKVPAEYGLSCNIVYYRDPKKGWSHENVRLFKKMCFTPRFDKQEAPQKMPPICNRLGVSGSREFSPDFIPDDVWKKCGVKRCSKEVREKWINDLSSEDKAYMNRNF